MLGFDACIAELWVKEKVASMEAIAAAKEVALTYLASEREKIMRMSHQQALDELLRVHKIEARIQTVQSVSDTGLLSVA
jgi:type II restriction enzyme